MFVVVFVVTLKTINSVKHDKFVSLLNRGSPYVFCVTCVSRRRSIKLASRRQTFWAPIIDLQAYVWAVLVLKSCSECQNLAKDLLACAFVKFQNECLDLSKLVRESHFAPWILRIVSPTSSHHRGSFRDASSNASCSYVVHRHICYPLCKSSFFVARTMVLVPQWLMRRKALFDYWGTLWETLKLEWCVQHRAQTCCLCKHGA